ncbi:peroxide stress protein YaaA [Glaciihabitans sp. dw_435]|uniref:YaaA family protein n=1 Tax=Glaciihabitans sp. dw_435 TaxID=2720081 RepID=UPI0027DCCF7F|nr:peroxide stress protein YaaA [Glaciihabitans sp. dw_435]
MILPPSETKRDGGDDTRVLTLDALSYTDLSLAREQVLSALVALSHDDATAAKALKIGPTLMFEVARNRVIHSSPVMPAMDRYTGVLYDGLAADTLDAGARAFLAQHVVVHSALFGLVGAGDPIPAYRMSHDTRLPELRLKHLWRAPVSAAIDAHDGLVLDLRSESYVELGPVPTGTERYYLRVLSRGADGTKRALNHFNKKGKGQFVRALAQSGIDHPTADSLLAWAAANNITLERGSDGELDLLV